MSKCTRAFIENIKDYFESLPMLTEREEGILEEAQLILEAEDNRLKVEQEMEMQNRI